ncbi:MAG: GspE/PulE family protein [bacterium]
MDKYKKLGEILLQKKWITDAQLEKALAIQRAKKERLGNILVEHNWITEDMLLDVLSERFGIEKVKIDSYTIDANSVKAIPMEMATRYKIIPLFVVGDILTLAMSDPLDIHAIDAVRYFTGKRVQEVVASEKDILAAITKFYSMSESMDQVLSHLEQEQEVSLDEESVEDKIHLNSEADEASIISYVNLLLIQALRDKASDMHFEPGDRVFRVRARVDGILREIAKPSFSLSNRIIARIKVLADLDVSEKRLPQDGRFRIKIENREIDARVSILPTVHGQKAVLRLLDPGNIVLKLEDMGFSAEVLGNWHHVIKKTEGIILITGPTGSGKTTSLYAVLNTINSIEKNIITVENPVEYKLPLINQVQVNSDIGMTFSSALRSILRQDPDIIMVGEIRDVETAEIAIRSALTGHLVLSTLHTNDALGAIFRLLDMGVENFLVATSINAVLAQRLVRKVCSKCKEEDPQGTKVFEKQLDTNTMTPIKVYKGRGCRECKNTGYVGRTGIYELLIIDDTIRQMILDNASENEIRTHAKQNGLRSLKEDGIKKVLSGITTMDEILRVSAR